MKPQQGIKRLTAGDLLDGAAVLVKMSKNIEAIIARSANTTVTLPKTAIQDIATMLHHAGRMVDNLVMAIERGECFDEKLPR